MNLFPAGTRSQSVCSAVQRGGASSRHQQWAQQEDSYEYAPKHQGLSHHHVMWYTSYSYTINRGLVLCFNVIFDPLRPSGDATSWPRVVCGVPVGSSWKDGGHWPNGSLCRGAWPGVWEVGWQPVSANWPGFDKDGRRCNRGGAQRRYRSKNVLEMSFLVFCWSPLIKYEYVYSSSWTTLCGR